MATVVSEIALHPVTFSGGEPESVVRWARRCRELVGSDPYCRLVGREPVTSTALFIEGRITEDRLDKYDRGFTVTASDGSTFKVGGTNTTSSIAAFFSVIDVPAALLPDPISEWGQVLDAVDELCSVGLGTSIPIQKFNELEYWARAERLAASLKEPLESLLPSGRVLLAELLHHRPLVPAVASPTELWQEVVEKLCRLGRTRPELAGDICPVLIALATTATLEFLTECLSAADVGVTRAAASGLRDMEFVAQRLSSESPLTLSLFVGQIHRALEASQDPETRVYLSEALGYFGIDDEDVLEALSYVLSEDEEDHVRWAAAVALGRRSRPVEALDVLIRSIRGEKAGRVKRAALLSLGRLLKRAGPDLLTSSISGAALDELEEQLLGLIKETDDGLATYAAYAIGELPSISPRAVNYLLQELRPTRSYAAIAHIVLALSKIQVRQRMSDDQRERLRLAMAEPLLLRDEREHPASSYHEWLTLTAWRILSRLEVNDLAAKFARRAAYLFRNFPARANYFEGLAHHQAAESSLETRGVERALSSLMMAIGCFNKAALAPRVAGDLGDTARMAAVTRASLAGARKSLLEAVREIDASSFRRSGREERVRECLRVSRELVEVVLISRPSSDGSIWGQNQPGASEQLDSAHKVLEWMREATYLLDQIEDLRLALADGATESDLHRGAGLLRGVVDRLGSLALQSESTLIEGIQDLLVNDILSCSVQESSLPGVVQQQVAQLITYLLRTLKSPIAVPDIDYRLLGAGRARYSVLPEGVVSGSGTQSDPWLFPPSGRLAVHAVVQVDLRSDEELLVLRCEDDTGFLREDLVQVHEGTEAVEIDLSDRADLRFTLKTSLSFVLSGYSERIADTTVYMARMEAAVRSESTSDIIDELSELRTVQNRLTDDLRQLHDANRAELVGISSERRTELAEVEARIRRALQRLSAASGDDLTANPGDESH